MVELNTIYCEDCRNTISKMISEGLKIDNIITSPFYNTVRNTKYYNSERGRETNEGRYDIHIESMTNDEYVKFTVDLFNSFDEIIKENGCILYNMNYGSENTELMWLSIAGILKETNWTIADDIIWKKHNALPNNTSPNKLTRIVEHIFVFCRKDEFKSFTANKPVSKVRDTGQVYYKNVFNFVEAKNNDGMCKLNKATYSTELIEKLLDLYVKENSIVYDPFMGTGTTAIACINKNINYIGSEISKAQVEYANDRIKNNQ